MITLFQHMHTSARPISRSPNCQTIFLPRQSFRPYLFLILWPHLFEEASYSASNATTQSSMGQDWALLCRAWPGTVLSRPAQNLLIVPFQYHPPNVQSYPQPRVGQVSM